MSIFDVDDIQTALAPLLRDFYGLDPEDAQGDARLLAEAASRAVDARQRIAEQTKHIRNAQDRAVARFNLWAKEPTR